MARTYRHTISLWILLTGISGTVLGQGETIKDVKYVISGTSIQGGIGLFRLSTPDVLPKGKFTLSGAYMPQRESDGRGEVKYALGVGLANRLEASAIFSNTGEGRSDIMTIGLKSNVVREEFPKHLLGSVEAGYMEIHQEHSGNLRTDHILIGRTHASTLVGDMEVFGNVGYAFSSGGGGYEDRMVWGGGTFFPAIRNLTFGIEFGTENTSLSSRQLVVSGGIRWAVLDHLQIIIHAPTRFGNTPPRAGIELNISFSSAFYEIYPGRTGGGRIPPLPSLEELEQSDTNDQ